MLFFLEKKYYNANRAEKSQEIVFWTLQMGDFADYMNGVIKSYEEKNPEVRIKWIDVPFSEGEKRTLAAILSNNPPDLVNLNPDFSATLAQKGALSEIDESKLTQFNPEVIGSLNYNGKIYAIPWYATSAITIYNRKLLNKAGFNTTPKTYEKLQQIAPEIKSKTGAYAFMPTITENDTMMKILNKYGITSFDTINSQKSQEVFGMFKDLYQENLIPKETVTQTQREALEKYMSGQIVFFQSGANFLNIIRENAPDVYANTDVARQFIGDLKQYDFSLMNLVVPLKSEKKQAAIDFALFLTNEENQLKLGKLTNVLATNEKALNNLFYMRYEEGDMIAKARFVSAKQLHKVQPAIRQTKNQKEVNILVNTAVQEILLGEKSIDKALSEVSQKWKQLNY